jgi:prevent-host-death family protein
MHRVLYMTTASLAKVRANLSEYVTSVHDTHDRVVITRNGEPAAVLISPDDLESLEETLAILADPEAVAAIREGEEAIARGEIATLHDVRADLERRGTPEGVPPRPAL